MDQATRFFAIVGPWVLFCSGAFAVHREWADALLTGGLGVWCWVVVVLDLSRALRTLAAKGSTQ